MSVNQVAISGNITRDAELRNTAGGTSILNFTVAVNERRKNQSTGEWDNYPNFVDCTTFGKRAESLAQYLRKGTKVAVSGRLHYSSWKAKDGSNRSKLDVTADQVDIMTPRNQQQQGYQQQYQQPQQYQQQATYSQEDIPF